MTQGIDPLWGELFPFRLTFDDDLRFVGFGPAIAKILPNLKVGARLPECFELKRPQVRAAAADALGRIGPAAKQAVPALQVLLADLHLRVREAAKKAIKRIDPRAKLELPPGVQTPLEEEAIF